MIYLGKLPPNYNIILGSDASTYGKLSVTGPTGTLTFGIDSGSVLAAKYEDVLQGLTTSNITGGEDGVVTGDYGSYTWELVFRGGWANIWDLLFTNYITGPNADNTRISVEQNAAGLKAIYNQLVAAYQAALSYDCTVYDAKNRCISAGGR